MSFDQIVGQEEAARMARAWLRTGRLPHAVLIAGPKGCGKREFAVELGKALVCTRSDPDACGACSACRRADLGTHPDIHFLVPVVGGKRTGNDIETMSREMRSAVAGFLKGDQEVSSTAGNISRDHLRLLQREMAHSPLEGRRRVAVILDAEYMHPGGANALLKILEEPPAQSVFILVSSAPDALISTVRSRCQRLALRRLGPHHLRRKLTEEGYSAEQVELGVQLGDGNLHRARSAARGDLDATLDRVERLLKGALKGDDAIYWELVEEFRSRDSRAQLERHIELCSLFLRDLFVAASGWPAGQLLQQRRDVLAELDGMLTEEQIERAGLELDRAAELLSRNVSPALVLADFWRGLHQESAFRLSASPAG